MRNTKFQEKSESGFYVSDFDIKDQIRLWKASQNKDNYAEQIGNQGRKGKPKSKIFSHFCEIENGNFYNPRTAIDRVKIQRNTMTSLYRDYMLNPQTHCGYIDVASQT